MRRIRPAFTASMVLTALALTGCSPANKPAIELSGITDDRANDPVKPIGPGGQITLTAFDLGFRDQAGTAIDGPNTFVVDNVGGGHNIVIDQAAGASLIDLPAGQTTEGVLELYGAPGDGAEYIYYCSIPGHRAAGMEGLLRVFLTSEDAEAAGAGVAGMDLDTEAIPVDEATEAETEEPTEAPTDEPTEAAAAADPADSLVAGEVTEDDIAALDDSADVAGALDGRTFARLYAVSFASGSADLESGADSVLDDLVIWLDANPDKNIRVEGNTDTGGDSEPNQTLSNERAQSVVDALVARGVDAARLTAKGNGETNTLVDDTDDDVAKRANRRVEVYVS